MTTIPLVSVIMPLYNKRPYVKRAITSIQQQTFSNWELIIVDNGSTDGSTDEIPCDDPKIRFFQQTNRGPGAARNLGISMAQGEFVTFLDADDYYYPNKLEEEMTLLWKGKMGEWMMSTCEYQIDNQLKFRSIQDINGNELKGQPLVFDNALNQLTIAGWPVNGLCIRKYLLERLGGFCEDMRCFEITELMIRCALLQPSVVIYPNPLYRVVDVPNSAFKEYYHRIDGSRQMGESLFNLSKNYPEFSNFLKVKSQKSLLSYVAMLILSGESKKARSYLTKKYPYSRNKRWLKIWIGSWIPKCLLQPLINTKLGKCYEHNKH